MSAAMGRPKLPKDDARQVYPLRLSQNEKAAFEKAATAQGVSLPEWIRKTLTEAAKVT
jgi:predicted HicB family RNase H-like nuclease